MRKLVRFGRPRRSGPLGGRRGLGRGPSGRPSRRRSACPRVRLAFLDRIIDEAVDRKDFPGAVLVVAHKGRTVYRKAFGLSQLVPEPRPLTRRHDLRSGLRHQARGHGDVDHAPRRAGRHPPLGQGPASTCPEFTTWYGEKGIAGEEARLYNLLTHTSGLPPYTDAKEAAKKIGDPCTTADLVKLIAAIPKELPVGKEFVYSCLNYITLAHIVHKVSGKPLDEFAAENIFKPLGMTRTFYRPPADLIDQCVPDGGRRRKAAPRRRPRSAGPSSGRRLRQRRAVLDGRRPGRLRPDAARPGRI